ncbi:uroporphyrinogen-III synthase [Salicibibacter cibarius]|uniref:Uroporphyrinogen-III synthase n=1 Tax=Salicibibacter cibarius TaxID=2743000 RepID=A0A7T6Z514_9BACI|nr:uroporphyrinogen-III synthase [Salicibibacter cibarius]QQK77128.1 uroporphyrinogen-III synthase [Salicibibacter cibarius]
MPVNAPIALVTRGKADQTAEDPLVSHLQALSVPVQHIPLVTQQMLKEHENIPAAREIDWLVFTSANAVHYFECLMSGKEWGRTNVRVATVGPKTAEAAASIGFTVDLVPEKTYTAEALAEGLGNAISPGETVVIPKSKQARNVLPDYLDNRGANVVDPAIYETRAWTESAHALATFLSTHNNGVITFTSPSAVHAFKQMQPDLPKWPAICIGTITAKAASEAGFSQVEAAFPHTFANLAERVSNYLIEVNNR